ncbi:hypothetical protein DDZ13_11365 [Coraliomargarita sinensis]|uniref:Uncharacterized protein n=1 Tax=Coraliomargarita sinensis TaxID=2174842 RepID=A0A317ZFD0_9BACT|nr:hypothetical protein [Coraliomargarita sinensis]PXA03572.1 hypothetical protein DDZ13_11365 [Coraliomargarita sinensis]
MPRDQNRQGFALIASIAIMAVLVLIAVTLYSLSSVATRSADVAKARTEAQANAKAALMLAIGELQASMGPDQRISANAAILDTNSETNDMDGVNHPHWLGVWDSWIAGDLADAPVNSNYPSPESAHQTIGSPTDAALQAGMNPDYSRKEDHFREWLVSLNTTARKNFTSASILPLSGDAKPGSTSTAVRLVGNGSLGPNATNQDYVSASLIDVEAIGQANSGRYAWWIGDESQKATVLADSYGPASGMTEAELIHRSHAPDTMGNQQIPGFQTITDLNELDKVTTGKTLDLVDRSPQPGANDPTLSQLNFHTATLNNFGVLADVREGGLKRDLNTLLERQIDLNDDGNEFMLYDFNREGETVLEERVPLQDLSAYYQLYRDNEDFSTGDRGGIKYTSSQLNGNIQTEVPDYGSSDQAYLREFTALYRNPVPVKVQFVLGVGASLITDPERAYANDWLGDGRELREEDIYKLSLGVKPVISLWNPNNVPLVMDTDAAQRMQVGFPPFYIQWKKYRASGGEHITKNTNLNYAITNESTHSDARARALDPFIIKVRFARTEPIVFEPGEIKTFTVDIPTGNWLENDGEATYGDNPTYDAQEFFPDGFYITAKTAPPDGSVDVVKLEGSDNYLGFRMVFAEGDKITVAAYPEDPNPDHNRDFSGLVARANEVHGGGLQFYLKNDDADNRHRNYQFLSRFGQDGNGALEQTTNVFNSNMILSGFPGGAAIPFESVTNATPGTDIASFTAAQAAKGLLVFTMMPGCELNNSQTGGFSAGRRITTRPFLHGSILSAPRIADNSPAGLYEYGWEWQVEKINDTEEVLQSDGNSRGYYGGSYNFGFGTTHVVQQYLPVLPPISIASLSSAHLGGYSLANNAVVESSIDNAPDISDFRVTTATGQGGLAPHTQQATGNSYAHPNIQANEAFTTYTREMNTDVPLSDQIITYVDHSYLANKALWDDYFFSSITPQFTDVQLQDASANKSAFDVAEDFLFNAEQLPNRRITPYIENLDGGQFTNLASQYEDFTDGFADKIASHLLVNGPFNVNSTSEDAWQILLTSLRDKSIAYLNETTGNPSTDSVNGETPVGPGMLPNRQIQASGSITSDPAVPLDQWRSWRSLSDSEISQLASALVRQVKERGPFLSLSEFINRRLDTSNRDLSVKGAMQAAIDDNSVSINATFRSPERSLDAEADDLEADGFIPQFPEALDGPIAYGSTPYIDQADILRHLGSVLTPRGDTFVIRTYGDKLNARGEVVARVWCEAVVQRTPDYIDLSSDENHVGQERLTSETNRKFGRKFNIVSFRWLDEDEV